MTVKKRKRIRISGAVRRQMQEDQAKAWKVLREDWRKQSFAEFGNHMALVAAVRDKFVPRGRQRKEFYKMLDETGVGDHPALLRFFFNVAQHWRLNYDR